MTTSPSNNEDHVDLAGNERCACGEVTEWADSWERCGAIVVHRGGAPHPKSHAPERLGGCFDVTSQRGG